MQNLAQLYLDTDKLDLALPLLEESLPLQKTTLGMKHPVTLNTMRILMNHYLKAQKYDRALPLMEAILPLEKANKGPEHRDTIFAMNGLGFSTGKRDGSRSRCPSSRTLKISAKTLGKDHANTLLYAYNLTVNFRDGGRLAEAAKVTEEWLPRVRKKFGWNHPDTQKVRAYGAGHLPPGGPMDPGRAVAPRICQYRQAEVRPRVAPVRREVGALSSQNLLHQKKYADAEPLLRECLAVRGQKEPDAWTTFNTQSMLGSALLGQKKYAAAEPLLLDGYEGMKKRAAAIPAPAKVRLLEALERLVQLYKATGQKDKAGDWRKQLEAARAAVKKKQP